MGQGSAAPSALRTVPLHRTRTVFSSVNRRRMIVPLMFVLLAGCACPAPAGSTDRRCAGQAGRVHEVRRPAAVSLPPFKVAFQTGSAVNRESDLPTVIPPTFWVQCGRKTRRAASVLVTPARPLNTKLLDGEAPCPPSTLPQRAATYSAPPPPSR